jgi:hypothetical protein
VAASPRHLPRRNGELWGYDTEVFYSPLLRLTIVALGNTSTHEEPVTPSPLDGLGPDGLVPLLAAAVAE